MAKAQVGDLIRVIGKRKRVTSYEVGGIYEVTGYCEETEQIIVNAIDGRDGYLEEHEYEIHRKAGEEDAPAEYPLEIGEPVGNGVKIDAVNPQHYKQGRTEVIDIIEDAVAGAEPFEAVCQANVLKYTLRYRHKNGVEDLKKAVWYAEKLIAHLTHK